MELGEEYEGYVKSTTNWVPFNNQWDTSQDCSLDFYGAMNPVNLSQIFLQLSFEIINFL